MTISLKCFEYKTKSLETYANWNTDGSLRIMQRADKKDDGTGALMTPSILKEIILAAKDRKKEGVFYDTGEVGLPSMMFPLPGRIVAEMAGKKIRITGYSGLYGLKPSQPFDISLTQLKAILNRSISRRKKFDKEIGIRPVFGPILRNDKTTKV